MPHAHTPGPWESFSVPATETQAAHYQVRRHEGSSYRSLSPIARIVDDLAPSRREADARPIAKATGQEGS